MKDYRKLQPRSWAGCSNVTNRRRRYRQTNWR